MTPINLSQLASKFKSGWLAINYKSLKIVAHSKDFASIMEKVKQKKDVFLFPASKDFSNIAP